MRESSTDEMRYRALFEAANDAMLVVLNGRVVDCNSRALQLFAVASEKLVGKLIAELSPELQPDGRSSVDKAQDVMLRVEAGESMLIEWRCRRLDGTLF